LQPFADPITAATLWQLIARITSKRMHNSAFIVHVVHVSPKTNWRFVRMDLNDGTVVGMSVR
jgi:hypothetical protein